MMRLDLPLPRCLPYRVPSVLLLALSWAFTAAAAAQSAVAPAEAPASALFDRGSAKPVIVSGEELFLLRGVSALPAEERVREVAERIEEIARDRSFDPRDLRIEDRGDFHRILAGKDREIAVIIDADAEFERVERWALTRAVKDAIARGIQQYREDRKPEVLMRNVVRALLRTVILALLIYSVFRGFRWLEGFAERRFKRRIENLETRSLRLIQAEQFWNVTRGILRLARAALTLFLIYIFLNFVLSLFPWTRRAADTLLSYVVEPLSLMAEAVIDFIPDLVFLILLFLVTRYLLKVIHQFFRALALRRAHIRGFDPEWAEPTYRIVRIVVIVMAVVIAYPYIPGSESAAFKGVSIMIGVLVSLGSTSIISNVIAGYSMTYRRMFRPGDRVKIGDIVGDVEEMRILVTTIRSVKNEEIVIPNSKIMDSEVVNYSGRSRQRNLILHTIVGIGYEVPWRQVEALLLLAAERTEGLLADPKPFVLQKSLADYAVNYEINAYCDDPRGMARLYSALHRNIQDAFNEHGVQIMTPSYEADPPDAKIVPKENWYAPPASAPQPKRA